MSDLYLVFSRPPAAVSEEEYQAWYHAHLRENLESPGFNAGSRYALDHTVAGTPEAFSHLAVYETAGPMADLRKGLTERLESGAVVLPPWFKDITFSSWHATVVDDRVEGR